MSETSELSGEPTLTPQQAYAPAASEITGPLPVLKDWREFAKRARRRLALGFIVFVATILIVRNQSAFAIIGMCGASAILVLASLNYLIALYRLITTRALVPKAGLHGFGLLFMSGFAVAGALFTFVASAGFGRGRQIRRFGKMLLPPVNDDAAWTTLPIAADASPELRSELAARWRWNGQTEHASIAAFARLTLDLMTLGAPPELIYAANRDAKDEIRHTELCFSLARALDGKTESPGPFPEVQTPRTKLPTRSLTLAQLAVDSLIDGALHEGLSARVIARLAKQCPEPAIRDLLREIAADEGRHSAHGWDVVEWCLAEGGKPVARALQGAIAALPESVDTNLPTAARDGSWERYGIHGTAIETQEHDRARRDLIRRVQVMTARAA